MESRAIFCGAVDSQVQLLSVGRVNSQTSAIELIAIEVSHGSLSRVWALEFTEAKTPGTTSFAILDNPKFNSNTI
jgi:hypothetical protein